MTAFCHINLIHCKYLLFNTQKRPLLIVEGPCGSGKMTTLTVLASDLGLRVIEYDPFCVSENAAPMAEDVEQRLSASAKGDDSNIADRLASLQESFKPQKWTRHLGLAEFLSRAARFANCDRDVVLVRDVPQMHAAKMAEVVALLRNLIRLRHAPRLVLVFRVYAIHPDVSTMMNSENLDFPVLPNHFEFSSSDFERICKIKYVNL